MKWFKRITIGIVSVVAVFSLVIYLGWLNSKPVYKGSIKIKDLQNEVTIHYDSFGVPHIYAQNLTDAYMALGYVHAQDRLFQMEMLRRAAAGELSEVLGKDLIPVDKLFRALSLNKFAEENAEKFLSSDTADWQKAALAYQKGINAFVEKGKTPIEFTLMGLPKRKFTPKDIYLAIGFMSFGFAEGLQADPVLEKIKNELGEDYLKDLAVQTPTDAVTIKNHKGNFKNKQTDSLIAFFNTALEKLPVPLWQGSNGWAVSAEKSATGFPILANDTHIGFAQPAVWYEAHLEFPGHSFYGHHIAGIPFGLLGNNKKVAWGLTMFENDDMDFYKEERNPNNSKEVRYKDGFERLKTRKEVIEVKDSKDVVLEIETTRHGPIISGLVDNFSDSTQTISMWWLLLHEPNRALEAAWLLNHADNIATAQKAASLFSAPGLNVMYADVEGNIAWWASAKLPVRPKHIQSKLFLNGGSGEDDYTEYYSFDKNPQAVNPPWGYVYSANNQPDSVNGILYPGYYYPKLRAGRVEELLKSKTQFTVDEMAKMQTDAIAPVHANIAKQLSAIVKEQNQYPTLTSLLDAWDGNHQLTACAPSVYYNLLSHVMYYTLKDELGDLAYKTLMDTSVPKNSFELLIGNANSPWYDDVKTDKRETRTDIVLKAAAATQSLLEKLSGKDVKEWQWQKFHTLTHNHPLGKVKPLDKIFSVGPMPAPGGMEVVNNLTFALDTTGYFPVTVGAALRKVTNLGDIENGITVSPSGQSGVASSEFYQDQASMFVSGKTRPMLLNKEKINQQKKYTLILKP
ncbi:MAG: penicillin acylase family protein [Chryseotalea sp.]